MILGTGHSILTQVPFSQQIWNLRFGRGGIRATCLCSATANLWGSGTVWTRSPLDFRGIGHKLVGVQAVGESGPSALAQVHISSRPGCISPAGGGTTREWVPLPHSASTNRVADMLWATNRTSESQFSPLLNVAQTMTCSGRPRNTVIPDCYYKQHLIVSVLLSQSISHKKKRLLTLLQKTQHSYMAKSLQTRQKRNKY